jgi:hypothetical protein
MFQTSVATVHFISRPGVESTPFCAAACEVLSRLLIYNIVRDRRVMTITIPVCLFSMLHGVENRSQKTRYRSLPTT